MLSKPWFFGRTLEPPLLVLDISLTTTLIPCFCAVEIRIHQLSRHLQKCTLSNLTRNLTFFMFFYNEKTIFLPFFVISLLFGIFWTVVSCTERPSSVWCPFAIRFPEILGFLKAIASVFWRKFPVIFLGRPLPLLL